MARGLPSGLMRTDICSRDNLTQYTECRDGGASLSIVHFTCKLSLTALQRKKRLVDFIVHSPRELSSIWCDELQDTLMGYMKAVLN
ncbi:hypothetical protein UPYG_G00237100 [Umbra pygmaea]|uniref:Uncharacterized protein n=1 Tax=Umbra pygmaea TaxID=75934 RepID=A0ABD0WEP1_UMBPY